MESPNEPMVKKSNPWIIVSIVLALALVVVSLMSFGGLTGSKDKMTVLSSDQAGTQLLAFINQVYSAQVGTAALKSVTEENGLYKVTVTVTNPTTNQPEDQPVYVSRDGKLFIPQVIDIDKTKTDFEAFQQQQQQAPADTQGTVTPPTDTTTPQDTTGQGTGN